MVLDIILLTFLYFCIGTFFVSGFCHDKKMYTFSCSDWSECSFPPIKTVNDKFVFFTYFLFWPLIVCFRYIPKLLYIICKFLVEYIAWIIVKIFKL